MHVVHIHPLTWSMIVRDGDGRTGIHKRVGGLERHRRSRRVRTAPSRCGRGRLADRRTGDDGWAERGSDRRDVRLRRAHFPAAPDRDQPPRAALHGLGRLRVRPPGAHGAVHLASAAERLHHHSPGRVRRGPVERAVRLHLPRLRRPLRPHPARSRRCRPRVLRCAPRGCLRRARPARFRGPEPGPRRCRSARPGRAPLGPRRPFRSGRLRPAAHAGRGLRALGCRRPRAQSAQGRPRR